MSRLVRPEGRTTRLAPVTTPAVRCSNRSMRLPIGWLIKVFMVSPKVLLERLRERRRPVDIASVVLPPRQAVVVVVAHLAFEVRMPLVDVDHRPSSLPSKRHLLGAVRWLTGRRHQAQ